MMVLNLEKVRIVEAWLDARHPDEVGTTYSSVCVPLPLYVCRNFSKYSLINEK